MSNPRGRLSRSSLGMALPNDPRGRRNAQGGLTNNDVDDKTIEVVNGRLQIKPAGATLASSEPDGLTLEDRDDTLRIRAVDHVVRMLDADLTLAPTVGRVVTLAVLTDEVDYLTDKVNELNAKLDEVLIALSQGKSS